MTEEKPKVLIAEDEKPIARALQLKLKKTDIEADVVGDGKSALDALEKGGYGLILLDLVMPEYDGFYVLEELQKKKSTVPVYVLSNLSQEGDEERARDLGAEDFFVKSNTSLARIVDIVTQKIS